MERLLWLNSWTSRRAIRLRYEIEWLPFSACPDSIFYRTCSNFTFSLFSIEKSNLWTFSTPIRFPHYFGVPTPSTHLYPCSYMFMAYSNNSCQLQYLKIIKSPLLFCIKTASLNPVSQRRVGFSTLDLTNNTATAIIAKHNKPPRVVYLYNEPPLKLLNYSSKSKHHLEKSWVCPFSKSPPKILDLQICKDSILC